MPIGSIIQGLGSFGTDDELYGRRVKVPDYPELDAAQRDAVRFNREILPDAGELASETNELNRREIARMLTEVIPDLPEINTNISRNIAAWTRGEIGDVANVISRKTAERAVAGGFSGSGMHHNLEARDLGLTSLEMTQRGMASAERWIASVRDTQAPIMDVTSMFVTPAQAFAAKEAKWQRDLYAETMAAAPDPARRGKFDTEMAIIGMVLSAYGGGPGYTGTYRQQQAPPPKSGGASGGMNWYQRMQADRAATPDYSSDYTGGWQNDNGGMPFV